jgi:hypothetical protein
LRLAPPCRRSSARSADWRRLAPPHRRNSARWVDRAAIDADRLAAVAAA